MPDLLAGDIGGTHTRLAVFSPERGPREVLFQQSYTNADFRDFETIVKGFLAETGVVVDRACLGVGGPVVRGRAKFTNLDWVLDAEELKRTFGWPVFTLINDMEALGHGVTVLEDEDYHTLNGGRPVAGGSIAILALGTGLGEGYVTHDGGRYHAHGCEGGHTAFAPVGDVQMGLLSYMNDLGHAHVSNERVCSGALGLPNLYAYLKSTGIQEPDWLAERLAEAEDPTPVIVEAARGQARPCELAAAAVELLVEILGAEAGNLALKILATGGVYLGGGMSPLLLPELERPGFLESMQSKGRFHDLLADMPVRVILEPHAGLFGAAACGLAALL